MVCTVRVADDKVRGRNWKLLQNLQSVKKFRVSYEHIDMGVLGGLAG